MFKYINNKHERYIKVQLKQPFENNNRYEEKKTLKEGNSSQKERLVTAKKDQMSYLTANTERKQES